MWCGERCRLEWYEGERRMDLIKGEKRFIKWIFIYVGIRSMERSGREEVS